MRCADDRLLSYGEVADLTGRSVRSVRRWVSLGLLRAVGIGRARWIRESDLIAALNGDSLGNDDGAGAADAAE